MNRLISEIVQPAVTVNSDTTVENVLQDIDWSSISSVVVEDDDKNVIGIITERDMIYAESLGVKKSDLKAWEVCTKKLVKIDPQETIRGAVELMLEHKVHHVLVMTGDYLEGVISSFDVMNEMFKHE